MRLSFAFGSTVLAGLVLAGSAFADRPITITIVHSNDLHAHVESTLIKKVPYGGYARQATLIKRIRAKEKNVLLLNAGDMFQGTLYFNVYEGLADAAYMNAIGYQAMAVGNHEFDKGPGALGTFAGHVQFPVLSANIDVSGEPALAGKIQPSAVVTVGGEKVGIVGATTPDTPNISSPGPTVKFVDLRDSVQRAVDDLTKQGINKIVLLTHIGYDVDQKLATQLHDVDVIVGGHSHTPLGTPDLPGWRKAEGPYPTYVKDATGRTVPIVQAYEWGKVLGELKVSFDGAGHVVKVTDAHPIVVDDKVPEDPQIAGLVAAFQKPIAQLGNQQIGVANEAIAKEPLPTGESLMADVIADSMLAATAKAGAVAAFVNSGGVRGSLEQGRITYGNAITVQPFNNTLVTLDVTGAELLAALEEGVGTGGELNPSHGTSYVVTSGSPKVTSVVVAGEPLDPNKTYRIALLNFTAAGGDNHVALKNAPGKRIDLGTLDIDALVDYIKANTPLDPKPENRIVRQ